MKILSVDKYIPKKWIEKYLEGHKRLSPYFSDAWLKEVYDVPLDYFKAHADPKEIEFKTSICVHKFVTDFVETYTKVGWKVRPLKHLRFRFKHESLGINRVFDARGYVEYKKRFRPEAMETVTFHELKKFMAQLEPSLRASMMESKLSSKTTKSKVNKI